MLEQEGLFGEADKGQLTFLELFADSLEKINAKFRPEKGVEFGGIDLPADEGLLQGSLLALFHCSIYLQFDLSGLNKHPLNFRLRRPERPVHALKIGLVLPALLDPAVYFVDILHGDHFLERVNQLPSKADLSPCLSNILAFGVNRLGDDPPDLLMELSLLFLEDRVDFLENCLQILVDDLLQLREHLYFGLDVLLAVQQLQLSSLDPRRCLHYLLVDQDPRLLHVHDVVVSVLALHKTLRTDASRKAVVAEIHRQLVSVLAAVLVQAVYALNLADPKCFMPLRNQSEHSVSLQSRLERTEPAANEAGDGVREDYFLVSARQAESVLTVKLKDFLG